MDSSAPPSFLCPITQEIMREPVTCADGHSYERASIELWLATHNTSPKTGAQLPNQALTPNHALRNAIEEWLSANFKLVPRSAVTFDEQAIAHGSFKSVHRGTLQGRSEPIAVLRMRMGGSCEEEAKKLVNLGRHPNLVRYFGLCTEGPEQLLLTELAQYGSLDHFLEAHEGQVTLQHKLKMLEQICAGMIAIVALLLIHRDLAARNILVFAFDASNPSATRVKITDFGLSVDRLYQTHAYGAQNEDVPFRWMPPEALRKRRFTEKSDVWAFGVTAWELFTDGEVPYGFIASNEAVAERVCAGERLTRPGECPDALWSLLQRMWAESPADRPTFVSVAGALGVLSSAGSEARALRRTTELAIPEHTMRLQRELPTPAATDRAAACPDGAARQATSPQDAQRLRLADGHFDKCEYAHALPLYEQARASFEAAGDRAGVGRACSGIADCYNNMGQPARALPLCEQARAILEAAGDRLGVGRACSGIAACYNNMGQYARALPLCEQARAIFEAAGDRARVGKACIGIAACYNNMGQYAQALPLFEQARAIAEAAGDRAGAELGRQGIAACYVSMSQHAPAPPPVSGPSIRKFYDVACESAFPTAGYGYGHGR